MRRQVFRLKIITVKNVNKAKSTFRVSHSSLQPVDFLSLVSLNYSAEHKNSFNIELFTRVDGKNTEEYFFFA